MGGKTLTRADLAEAVFQKVGLPRNKSAEIVELVLREIVANQEHIQSREAFLLRLVRYSRPDRTQKPKDRSGSSYYAAASSPCSGRATS